MGRGRHSCLDQQSLSEQAAGPYSQDQDHKGENDDFPPLGLPEVDHGFEHPEGEPTNDAASGVGESSDDGAGESFEGYAQAEVERSGGDRGDEIDRKSVV